MKVKLSDGKEQEINLKRKHTRKVMKSYGSIMSDEKDTGNALEIFNELLDEIAMETTGMTQEQYDNLDAEDTNLILNKIQETALGQLDFLKSSLKLGN